MPLSGEPLSIDEVHVLKTWIDQGADGMLITQEPKAMARLALVKPEAPSGSGPHPIDSFLEAYFLEHRIVNPEPAPDEVFVRRAFLDLWGLPPTPEQRQEFLDDRQADKHERLIDRLLAERTHYSQHWISYWNDLLHNDEGVVYPAGQRESITRWLLHALEANMPYDQMVRELLNPVDAEAPKGFLVGVNWGGDTSASQIPEMQAAQNSAQVFLGENLKCAGCHDSFVSRWKLRETYGLAAFFSEQPLDVVRCDVKTGEQAVARFLFPELDEGEPGATLPARRAEVARLFTAPQNGRFARTLVNRYWKRLFGRGLVEPPDSMDGPSWHANLLEWLASEFVEHDYDLQFLLRRIMTSAAYRLPAIYQRAPEKDVEYVFRGPEHRRLTAEQFIDAISGVTGEWRVFQDEKGGGELSRDWRLKSGMLTRALGRPNRNQVITQRDQDSTMLQALELVNGEELASLLQRGAKRILNKLKTPPPNLFDSGAVTSGKAVVDIDILGAERLWLLAVDAGAYGGSQVTAGWMQAEFIGPSGDVTPLLGLKLPPQAQQGPLQIKGESPVESLVTGVPSELIYDIQSQGYTRFRAVVGVDVDSLRPEVGGKVRFFVFSQQPEFTQLVRLAGGPPVPRRSYPQTSDALTGLLYNYALSRDPTEVERTTGRDLIDQFGVGGLEDLLWVIFLSPEFQFIR